MGANAYGSDAVEKILTVILAIAIAGAATFSTLYYAFAELLVDDFFQTLEGKDMIQFFDENGDEIARLIYPDGFAGSKHEAIKAFILLSVSFPKKTL